jgi:hypothetical protein
MDYISKPKSKGSKILDKNVRENFHDHWEAKIFVLFQAQDKISNSKKKDTLDLISNKFIIILRKPLRK